MTLLLLFISISYLLSLGCLLVYWVSVTDGTEYIFWEFFENLTNKLSKRFMACWTLFFPVISPVISIFVIYKGLQFLLGKFIYLWKLALFGEEKNSRNEKENSKV